MNTWFYDGSMPEYWMHNHELLTGIGETPGQTFRNMGKYWSVLAGIWVAGFFVLVYASSIHKSLGIYDPEEIYLRIPTEMKKERLALQADPLGTCKIL